MDVIIYYNLIMEVILKDFNFVEIIRKKREGEMLQEDEIRAFIQLYLKKGIPDYQVSAFLMAIYFQGLDEPEIIALINEMIKSGRTLDLSDIDKPKVDKHSTGGVGDKASIILAPLMASCGVVVPMITGRALGFTGGTADKMESIPGYKVELSLRDFKKVLKKVGCSIITQTDEIAPVDKKLYALRDVTGTVSSVPLIVSSILSKKLSEDIDGLVLDIKVGRGAFLKRRNEAKMLAFLTRRIGQGMGKHIEFLFSNMDVPIGRAVGNLIEVVEAIDCMQGNCPNDLMDNVLSLGERMLYIAGIKAGVPLLEEKIKSGEALDKFKEMVKAQGGKFGKIKMAKEPILITSLYSGTIQGINAYDIGLAATIAGAGRLKKEAKVDPYAGIYFLKTVGEAVQEGESIARIYTGKASDELLDLVRKAFVIK